MEEHKMSENATMDRWVVSTSLSVILLGILNAIVVPMKEKSEGFKNFFIDFGGWFGINHHLYGHILLFAIIFVILTLIFALTGTAVSITKAIKIDDYTKLLWAIIASIVLYVIVIGLFYLLEVMEKAKTG